MAFIVRGAQVFDGERVAADVSVVVRDRRIAAVGHDVGLEPGDEPVDATGCTLLPGLIDAHVHAWGPALGQALAFGVTTELDQFTDWRWAASMREEQRATDVSGRADLYSSGTCVTCPGGHGTEYGLQIPTIRAPEEAASFVDARIDEGADWIKVIYGSGAGMPSITRETLSAIVDAAHARGKLAVVHAVTARPAREAALCGADALAHVFADSPPDDDLGAILAQGGGFAIPTLTVLESTLGAPSGERLLEDPRVSAYLDEPARRALTTGFPRPWPGALENAFAAVRVLRQAGVPVLCGTDAGNPGTSHGVSMFRELDLLVEAGLSPLDALTAATSAPADAFGLSDRGRVAEGLRADLVLVRGDVSRDVSCVRDIVAVWKAGVRLDREAWRAEEN